MIEHRRKELVITKEQLLNLLNIKETPTYIYRGRNCDFELHINKEIQYDVNKQDINPKDIDKMYDGFVVSDVLIGVPIKPWYKKLFREGPQKWSEIVNITLCVFKTSDHHFKKLKRPIDMNHCCSGADYEN